MRRDEIVQHPRAVPRGKIDEPRLLILYRRTAVERDVPLNIVDVFSDLCTEAVVPKLTGIVMPGVMPVHRYPRARHLPDIELPQELFSSLQCLGPIDGGRILRPADLAPHAVLLPAKMRITIAPFRGESTEVVTGPPGADTVFLQ